VVEDAVRIVHGEARTPRAGRKGSVTVFKYNGGPAAPERLSVDILKGGCSPSYPSSVTSLPVG
jgi:hypothetical protein